MYILCFVFGVCVYMNIYTVYSIHSICTYIVFVCVCRIVQKSEAPVQLVFLSMGKFVFLRMEITTNTGCSQGTH